MMTGLVVAMSVLTGVGLMAASAPASASREPDGLAHLGELQDALRAEHPETFAGLWLDGDDVVVAAVSGDPEVLTTAAATCPEPVRLRVVPADYSEAELEDAMAELNIAFGTLADEQSVHALGVHLQRNRVVLEAADPDEVDLTPYISESLAEMVVVEGGVPPTTLESEDAADGDGSGASVVLFAGAGLLLLGAGGFWYARRRQAGA